MLAAAASAWTRLGRPDDAVRAARRAAELSPSFDTLYALAELHRRAGREAEYVAALERAFRFPSAGLDDARARVELAYLYLSRGDYVKARPYADEAVESYAAWAIACEAHCLTGLGEYDTAEEWVKRMIVRYPETGADWYAWCRLPGRSAVATAKFVAGRLIDAYSGPGRQGNEQAANIAADMLRAQGRDAEAASFYEMAARRAENPGPALDAALGYLRSGDRERALGLLKDAGEWKPDDEVARTTARRAKRIHEAFVSGEPLPRDLIDELEALFATTDVRRRSVIQARYGDLLVLAGNREVGLRFLTAAAAAFPRTAGDGTMFQERATAARRLKERLAEGGPAGRPPVEAPRPTDEPEA